MVSRVRGFRLNCTLRVLLLALNCMLLALLLPGKQYVTITFLGLLAIAQTLLLIRYVEHTNRSLELFLQSIDFSDYSQRLYPGPAGKSFSGLRRTFEKILADFRELSASREEELRYLLAVVQHVGIGLIAFNERGEVSLFNGAARTLLDMPQPRTVSDVATVSPELAGRIRSIEPGRSDLVTISIDDELLQVSLHATELRKRTETFTLVSLQNINLELNEKEMEAWQNLIRVLTHEIKNSLTPIASLAASVEQLIVSSDTDPKAVEALQVIQRRSQGLLQFVDTYRDLTHLPKPEFKQVPVSSLFSRVEKLVEPHTAGRQVKIRTGIKPETMALIADPELLEQVLINLVINALQATEDRDDAEISVEARFDERSRPVISVSDNGHGIVQEALDKIFIPFYSTRNDGSGIGLSLSRQIMRLHRGDLTVRSKPAEGAVFMMRF